MDIKLYNTLSRSKEVFVPIKEGKVGVYSCGPTVYNYAHIGNLRTYVFMDILRRIFEYNGSHIISFQPTSIRVITTELEHTFQFEFSLFQQDGQYNRFSSQRFGFFLSPEIGISVVPA